MNGTHKVPTFIVILILIAFSSVSGCASNYGAEVYDRHQPPSRRVQNHYVEKGDTLFSIAWRYSIDYQTLAKHNRIPTPYTIYPGQVIRLDVGSSRTAPTDNRPSTIASQLPPPMATRQSVTSPPRAVTVSPAQRSDNRTTKTQPTKVAQTSAPVSNWQWPAQGVVIARFQGATGLNKGIDIAGNLGQPVIAAASGQVVYAGTGLRGYGKLLIVKHSSTFLSAYAHNDVLHVKEGEQVKAGQKIASMGSSSADRVKLHFEIRRDGTPVDPLQYLPKR